MDKKITIKNTSNQYISVIIVLKIMYSCNSEIKSLSDFEKFKIEYENKGKIEIRIEDNSIERVKLLLNKRGVEYEIE